MGTGGEAGGSTMITADAPHSGALTAGGSSRRHPRGRASSAQDQGKELERIAKTELLQLRIACIHPQLTAYWKELSSELQLQVGGRGEARADLSCAITAQKDCDALCRLQCTVVVW